jgi:hypothetical protein
VKYDVQIFINAGPDSFCGVCSRWGHGEGKSGALKMPACTWCAGEHVSNDHKCTIVDCKVNAGNNCTHNVDNCVHCKGGHISRGNVSVKKQEETKKAKEEMQTWKEREGERQNVTTKQHKDPQ